MGKGLIFLLVFLFFFSLVIAIPQDDGSPLTHDLNYSTILTNITTILSAGGWTTTGANTYLTNATGKVGIGADPSVYGKLALDGNLFFNPNSGKVLWEGGSQMAKDYMYSGASDYEWRTYNGTDVVKRIFLNAVTGNVGIGTTSPTYTLDVNGGTDNTILNLLSSDVYSNFRVTDNGGFVEFGTGFGDIYLNHDNTRGMTIKSGTHNTGIGLASVPYKLSIGSTNGSDVLGLYHDNTDAYFRTDDGSFIFKTDEGTNTNTQVRIMGKGTGFGRYQVFDEDDAEYLYVSASGGSGFLEVLGASPGSLRIQPSASSKTTLFDNSAEGETQELEIYGYKTGDSKRSLQIGVGVDADDTASFDGVSNYLFNGNMNVSSGGTTLLDIYSNGGSKDPQLRLMRDGAGSRDWRVRNNGGSLYYDYSADEGASWDPALKFDQGVTRFYSSDATNNISLYHDNTNAYMRWDDGELNLQTDEGTNTNTLVYVKGKGTSRAYFRVFNGAKDAFLGQDMDGGNAQFYAGTDGGTIYSLQLQSNADVPVSLYQSSADGETQDFKIYGRPAGESAQKLEISVGEDANDTASFDGVSNYQFDGNIIGNQIYGGAWYHNHTGTILDFSDGVWYNLFLANATHLNGFTFQGGFNQTSNLTAEVAGLYQTNYMASGDGQNNHEYFTTIFVNGVEREQCGTHHKMSAGGDILTQSGNCFIELDVNDVVEIKTMDDGDSGSGNYYSSNLNLVRIGE